jgi:hypothetical protein
MTTTPLATRDWLGAAWFLDCKPSAIRAFAEVESPLGGYLSTGEPTILFERHVFHRLTSGEYDGRKASGLPDRYAVISSPTPSYRDRSYGPRSKQHARLAAAVALDRDAALQSASWGRFQIMASNWRRCGYGSLQAFVNGMIQGGESEHLRAFCCFVRSDERLATAIREQDWETAAELYNGRDFRRTGYHLKMAAAFASFEDDEHLQRMADAFDPADTVPVTDLGEAVRG